jgi:DNA-3-methyladenine glycosylase I
MYERLCLEGFQSGLSWLTILRKREAFRAAFEGFEPERVAAFGDRDVQRLLEDASIVRHRGKIDAAIANARATIALRASTPLQELLWQHRRDSGRAPGSHLDWQGSTPESTTLAKDLRRAGFRFVGPTTVYAAMQACGVVNDHLANCWVREVVEAERREA